MSDPMRSKKEAYQPKDKWEAVFVEARKGSLTWDDCGAEDLKAALVRVTEDGAALLLSKTSDGGALLVQILDGSPRKKKHYAASMAELNALLEAIANA